MKVTILGAKMTHSEDSGYVGHIQFEVEQHKQPYEVTIQSDNGRNNWSYALNFSNQPGSEEEIQAVDEQLEEDDAFFEQFVIAANKALE
ncbi:hypothetical protein [Cohnella cholangitidis]|uniref:Uncharacterized protein n=1 Tax=Cohnella cholangitidis TaxID=2598458 RepID=A0A7G5C5L7_9BACL|nr:hypothetical protein [Cohnella cholangitidis]QMV44501.1 hypothetical protein FPL14_27515 [Cohnella cholangitidis]